MNKHLRVLVLITVPLARTGQEQLLMFSSKVIPGSFSVAALRQGMRMATGHISRSEAYLQAQVGEAWGRYAWPYSSWNEPGRSQSWCAGEVGLVFGSIFM